MTDETMSRSEKTQAQAIKDHAAAERAAKKPAAKKPAAKKPAAKKPAAKKPAAKKPAAKKPAAKKPAATALAEVEKMAKAKADKIKALAAETRKLEAEQKKAEELAKAQKKREADQKKAATTLERAAKEIGVRMEKADRMVAQADDHRLAASIQLAEAQATCKSVGLSFKDWCDENLKKMSDRNRRLLLSVGKAELEEEGAGAAKLEDMREQTKKAVAKSRAKQKAKAAAQITDTSTEIAPATARQAAAEALAVMPEKEAKEFIKRKAADLGVGGSSGNGVTASVAAMKTMWRNLSFEEKQEFAEFVDEELAED